MKSEGTTTAALTLEPVIIVIFGITGDLAQRKLLPALYHLFKDGLLHEDSKILGVSRRDVTAETLLGQVELCVNEIDKACDPIGIGKVRAALQMHQMDLESSEDYDKLLQMVNGLEDTAGRCMNRLYYLAIPPQSYHGVVTSLGRHGHNGGCQHGTAVSRLLVEKPFGHDTASARSLIQETSEWFHEDQIFRIDHYVAKETVQNILTFRTCNPLFSTIWNKDHISSISVTAYEKITIEGRANFYEGVGALRDFTQSHLMQLLTVITMEIPGQEGSDAVHDSKQALLKSIHQISPEEVPVSAFRGQYAGYREEVKNPETTTETYASLTLQVDNERWNGVPMTIRTGKAMSDKLTEIRIAFHGKQPLDVARNELIFHIQPREGISLHLNAKKPGFANDLQSVDMNFNYQQSFAQSGKAPSGHPDAYERVLVDAARGDHTLFTTSDEVIEAWHIIEHVLRAWENSADNLVIYPRGSESVG